VSPSLLASASAAVFVLGVLAAARWLRPQSTAASAASAASRRRVRRGAEKVALDAVTGGRTGRALSVRLFTLLAAGVLGWLLTGWPVMLIAGPLAVIWLPKLFSDQRSKQRIARLEALEDWTRSLAGVLIAGTGIEQAIERTHVSAPEQIRLQVTRLAQRLRARWSTVDALRAFGNELDDATADLAVGALILAAQQRGPGLVTVLEGLAQTVSDAVRARRAVEIERDKQQSQVRMVTGLALATVSIIAVFGRTYLEAYSTPIGQVALVVLMGVYIGLLVLMRQMAASKPPARLLPASEGPRSL
jgi:Flp pilus assembly protein TadB